MSTSSPLRPLVARGSRPLRGEALVAGDKSISHRALILGALAVGETRVTGLLEAEDVLNTAEAMRAFGARVTRDAPGTWRVNGVGVGGFAAPESVLDFGNSGTGSRLVMGAMSTTPIAATFTGDASLRKRPMKRVLDPLTKFGATYDNGLMPLTVTGANPALCIDYEVTVASAQVKSALLLAALNAAGRTRIVQRALTRDHTEKMLKAFGADIRVNALSDGGEEILLMGEAELRPCAVEVPRDPSSAAFPLVAALVVPGSELTIPSVLLNARRIGLIDTLREMGANIEIGNIRESGGEQVGDLVARHSQLKGVDVPADRAPSMIDEYGPRDCRLVRERQDDDGWPRRIASQGKRPAFGHRRRIESQRRHGRGIARWHDRDGAGRRERRRHCRHAHGSPHRDVVPRDGAGIAGARHGGRRLDDRHQLPRIRAADARPRRGIHFLRRENGLAQKCGGGVRGVAGRVRAVAGHRPDFAPDEILSAVGSGYARSVSERGRAVLSLRLRRARRVHRRQIRAIQADSARAGAGLHRLRAGVARLFRDPQPQLRSGLVSTGTGGDGNSLFVGGRRPSATDAHAPLSAAERNATTASVEGSVCSRKPPRSRCSVRWALSQVRR